MTVSDMRRAGTRRCAVVLAAVSVVLAACGGHRAAAVPSRPPVGPSATVADAAADAGRSDPVADPVYPGRGDPALDVLHYGLDLAWDPPHRMLSGTATLQVRIARPAVSYTLDFGSALTADSVLLDGVAVAVSRIGDRMTVPLGHQDAAGTRHVVTVAYHGVPETEKAPSTQPDVANVGAVILPDGGVWSAQEPFGAFTWYPVDDQPSDKALYDVDITVPDGWSGVSGGTFEGSSPAGHSRSVFRWHQPHPVASYLQAFAVDRLREQTGTGPHGLPLTFWFLSADAAVVQPLIEQVPAMLTWLEGRYGPYPFESAGAVFIGGTGMETQTMVTVTPRIPADGLLHELAHQWFGDTVTPATWSDLWLNEGFAVYTQTAWKAEHDGEPLDQVMAGYVTGDQNLRTQYGAPGHYDPAHFAASNVYICPALMLNELRHRLGDNAFLALLRDWVQQHRDSSADRAEFTAFASQHAGTDLKPLIDAWLDSPTTPATTYGSLGGPPSGPPG